MFVLPEGGNWYLVLMSMCFKEHADVTFCPSPRTLPPLGNDIPSCICQMSENNHSGPLAKLTDNSKTIDISR